MVVEHESMNGLNYDNANELEVNLVSYDILPSDRPYAGLARGERPYTDTNNLKILTLCTTTRSSSFNLDP